LHYKIIWEYTGVGNYSRFFYEGKNMKTFKIVCTIEITTEAEDEHEALEIAEECADWSSADWSIEEIEE
jgi:hypothetical protein